MVGMMVMVVAGFVACGDKDGSDTSAADGADVADGSSLVAPPS